MKFRTEIAIRPSDSKIDHRTKILTIGSCFASNVAERLVQGGFKVCANPLGEMFNVCSVAATIGRLAESKCFGPDDLHQRGDMWFSYDSHGAFDGTRPEVVLSGLNKAVEQGAEALRNAEWVFITLGTAWVYGLVESGCVVANCHKMPAERFERKRLSVSDVVDVLLSLVDGPLKGKRVVLTVSPVRHLADGLEGNAISKATLRVAVEEVVKSRSESVSYFAAYEAVIDDLRDYRYTAADLSHPSEEAVAYVWELFQRCYFAPETEALAARMSEIKRAVSHRPLHPESEEYMRFCRAMVRKAEALAAEHAEVDLSAEIAFFGNK